MSEKAERLTEMKRQPFPRCSIAALDGTMDPPESWAALVEQHVHAEIIDRYLRGFVAPGEENHCPFCGGGFFGWGIVHGQGNCMCGWPATLYHYVYDHRPRADLPCSREGCGERRDEHVETPVRWVKGGTVTTRIELRCPADRVGAFANEFKPPLIAGFTRLLWAHPYATHLRRP